jgi:DNA end-binding protein Ku
MWTGSLSFGLVNVPVKMYAATEDHSVRFHQVHLADGGRIRMKRVCSEDGEEVPYAEIGKGYETAAGQRVVFAPAELEELPRGPKKEIEVVEFVPNEQLDPVLFDSAYYLEPDGRALKPYVLLREALQSTERTAVVKIAIRQRTQLAALRVRGDVLVLQTMLLPDEVRRPDFGFLGEDVDVRPQELQMAQLLIDNLSGDFDPQEYTDEYREAILAMIDAKLAGGEAIAITEEGEVASAGAKVVDLMAALQASVARTAKGDETSRSDESASTGDDAGPVPPPRKRAPAKKTAKEAAPGTPPQAQKPAAARKTAPSRAAKKPAAKKPAAKPPAKSA